MNWKDALVAVVVVAAIAWVALYFLKGWDIIAQPTLNGMSHWWDSLPGTGW